MTKSFLVATGVAGCLAIAFISALCAQAGAPTMKGAEMGAANVVTGSIGGLPMDGGKAVALMGHQGCLVMRNEARWEEIRKRLMDAGWQPGDKSVLKPNFDEQAAVLVFQHGDDGHKFSVRGQSGDADKATLEIVMSCVIYKARASTSNNLNFILVPAPRSKELTVTVSTYYPFNGPPNNTPGDALLEWKAAFGAESGDIVDGVRGNISPEKKTIKTGEDIMVKFQLEPVDAAVVKNGQFARPMEKAFVWDGKYSEGYHNHAFLVTTPDGKTGLYQPKVILNWDKNAPHPEEIAPGKPYVLPGWTGEGFKSLKALGLDTRQAGKYTITGVYSESGERTERDGKTCTLWGGSIGTNTLTVEVE
jgi:hypothetical protein